MLKSYLFTPGDHRRKIEKALSGNADAVIVDFEDGVAEASKDVAREVAGELLSAQSRAHEPAHKPVFIRTNSVGSPHFKNDMDVLGDYAIEGVMLAKCERSDDVLALREFFPRGEIIPLIESALGVRNLEQILNADAAVSKLAFGAVDFALDLGIPWSLEGVERRYAMGALVLKSRALGKEPPIDAVFPVLDNQEQFKQDFEVGQRMGFHGKMAIHPRQVEWIHELTSLPPEELDWFERIVCAYEAGSSSGSMKLDGKLIDLPVYLHAKQARERHGRSS